MNASHFQVKIVLYMLFVVFAVLLNSVGTVVLQSITSYEITKSYASILEACKDLSLAVGSFAASAFLCAFGFRRAVLASLGLSGIACLMVPLFPSFLTLKILFVCAGLAFAPIKVAVYSAVSKITHDSGEHASVITTIDGMFMVGVLLSGWLFSAFVNQENPADLSWLNVYWVLAGGIAATMVLVMQVPFHNESTRINLKDEARLIFKLLWQPLLLVFLGGIFLYVTVEQAVGTWLPTFYKNVMHLPNHLAIQMATLFAGSIALGRFASAPVLRRMGWFPVLITCIVATVALVWATIPMTHNMAVSEDATLTSAPLVVYLFPMIGFFLAPIYPVLNSVVLSALPEEQHPQMVVLCIFFSAFGGSIGATATGMLFQHFDGQTAFLMTSIPLGLLLIVLVAFKRVAQNAGTPSHA
jgi:MFS transporter, FHS family, glucose/mannose:H+ symporter